MRISDWSSDVCSSDLAIDFPSTSTLWLFRDESGEWKSAVPEELLDAGSGPWAATYVDERLVIHEGESRSKDDALAAVVLDLRDATWHRLPDREASLVPMASVRSEEHTSALQSLMRIS